MITFLKKIPWWMWVVVVVGGLLLWQSMSGWAMSGKLYKMALDNLREDQTQVLKDKDAWIKSCEAEIDKLAQEKERVQLEQLILQKKNAQSEIEISRLMGENYELQDRFNRIVISDDPDRLLEDLRGRGLNIRRINPR